MRGFLQKIIDRRLRQLTLATTLGILGIGTAAVVTGRATAPKLDDATLALERAQALLMAAQCEGATSTTACEKYIRHAGMLLVQARQALSAASTEAVGGDVELPLKKGEKK